VLKDIDRARRSHWQAAALSGGFDLFGHWGGEGGVSDARVQSVIPTARAILCYLLLVGLPDRA
jgi:hypothetical protein